MSQRRLIFKNILNCRDLGGYPSKYGVTKFGRFLRAGIVDVPNEEEIKTLEEYGIKTAIDLRGDFEFEDMKPSLERIDGCTSRHISLYEANVANADGFGKKLNEIYVKIAEENKTNVKSVLSTIADADDGAIIFHCYFGKDRTGIVAMLLLTIAGVSEDDIIADYQQTYTYIKTYVHDHADILWSRDCTMHYSLPETMEHLIEYIKKIYGSVLGYIKSTGITDAEIERIRARFF